MKKEKNTATIGLWSAMAIGIGGMIGAGIFSVLGIAAKITGNLVYLSFIFAGVIALLSTYSYAKLSSKYPSAGGPVEFLIRGFGDGILSGGFNFLLYFGYVFVLGVYAEAFGSYAATFLPQELFKIGVDVFAILIILIFTLINFLGPKAVGKSETLIVGIKVSILIVFAVVGLFFIKPSLLIVSTQINMERYRKPGTPGENTIGKRSKSSFNWILRADRTPFIPWRYLMFLGGPLLLGSIYGFIIGLLMSLSLVLRIIGEEKMLTEELEG